MKTIHGRYQLVAGRLEKALKVNAAYIKCLEANQKIQATAKRMADKKGRKTKSSAQPEVKVPLGPWKAIRQFRDSAYVVSETSSYRLFLGAGSHLPDTLEFAEKIAWR